MYNIYSRYQLYTFLYRTNTIGIISTTCCHVQQRFGYIATVCIRLFCTTLTVLVYINCMLFCTTLTVQVYSNCMLFCTTLTVLVYINCMLFCTTLTVLVYINCMLFCTTPTFRVDINCMPSYLTNLASSRYQLYFLFNVDTSSV